MKPAFMVIDMQKEYFKRHIKECMLHASEYINEVAGYFREKNLPVVFVQDIHEPGGVIPGSEGFEVIDALEQEESDIVIHKTYGNTFNKTECGSILKKLDVDVIVMAGFSAEHCVLATYRGAMDLDFIPVLLNYGVVSMDKENVRFVEKISDTISYKMIGKMLEQF